MTATNALAPSAFATCPRCWGHVEFDEAGAPYACYFCCNTGTVPAEVALAEERAAQDLAEQFAPRALGIFIRRPAHEWDWDEEPAAPGHRLFTRLPDIARSIEAEHRAARASRIPDPSDDIPF